VPFDARVNSLQVALRAPRIAVGKDRYELVAAVSRHQVHGPVLVSENFCECPQNAVPDDMAQGVVVFLEGIQIEQDERQFSATLSRGDFSLEVELEMAAVGQSGQGVGEGERLEVGV
jgi:hypothetical protein